MSLIHCVSPVDGSVFAERPALPESAALAAVGRARAAQKAWAARPLAERVALVRVGVAALGAMNAEITIEIAHMMGRPVRYGGEFRPVNERAEYMSEIAARALADDVIEDGPRFRRLLRREPHGVVFVIAPWNYPYLTAINTIVPALIAGNAVMIKPASQTLLTGERLVKAFASAGVPADLFQNIFLTHETTTALLNKGAFDFVNFTGSTAAGAQIERAMAGTFKGLGLELGGKDPAYVMADADLDAAVDTLMDGALYNSGQCCCGIERIYVHQSLYKPFVEKAVAWAKAMKLGNPLDPATTLGPMAHKRFAATVRDHIREAVAAGATAHLGVDPADDGGAYIGAEVLTGVNHQMRVMREETFGPVVGIMPVSSDEEALTLMNDCDYGLTVSLWTRDPARAEALGARLETGTVFMNRCDYLDPALCWTGCKQTGRGGALSTIGYHNLTRPKSYHLKKALS